MATKPAPPFANIFFARNIDIKIRKLVKKIHGQWRDPTQIHEKFLDDIFDISWDH